MVLVPWWVEMTLLHDAGEKLQKIRALPAVVGSGQTDCMESREKGGLGLGCTGQDRSLGLGG